MKKKIISLTLDPNLVEDAKHKADALGISTSAYISMIISCGLRDKKEFNFSQLENIAREARVNGGNISQKEKRDLAAIEMLCRASNRIVDDKDLQFVVRYFSKTIDFFLEHENKKKISK